MSLFHFFHRRTHVSQSWLRDQERKDHRVAFEGVNWNWRYLIRKMKVAEWKSRGARTRREHAA